MISKFAFGLLLLWSSFSFAEAINQNPLSASAKLYTNNLPAGANTKLEIQLQLASGYHAYLDMFRLKVSEPDSIYISPPVTEPVVEFYDKFSKKNRKGVKDQATMISALEVPADFAVGQYKVDINLIYQACTEKFCLLPKTINIPIDINVLSSDADFGHALQQVKPDKKPIAKFENEHLNWANEKGLLFLLAIIFFAGFLTSLTPCIFPMIPITLAVIGAQSQGQSRLRGFLISLSYVHGIAFTYSLLGVIAAKTGSLFGSFLGRPEFAIAISAFFFVMALSMFGLFEIKLPDSLATKLHSRKSNVGFIGAFISGLLAGVVASPCVGPVLISVLAYVSQTQDMWLGFIMLFTFAMGLGVLFMLLGAFSQLINKVPKAGGWMARVKMLFGVMMIGLSVYYIYPVLPQFELYESKVEWTPYSDEALAQAIANKQPVIFDVYADWCLSCKELERYTFNDPKVLKLGENFLWLKFDATQTSEMSKKLERQYKIFGLPNIIFYDSNGDYRPDLTLTGMEKVDKFLERMQKALNP